MRILSVGIKDDYVFTSIFSSPKFTKLLVDGKRPNTCKIASFGGI
jgi:hypothetical protein